MINLKIDQLFSELPKERDSCCVNPVTLAHFLRGEGGRDSIAYQKRLARKALEAREWFALNGPRDAPPLPMNHDEWNDMRWGDSGIGVLVAYYARSLAGRDFNLRDHPSFEEFARGLLMLPVVRRQIGQNDCLFRRYPPRALAGMIESLTWWPPKRQSRRTRSTTER
jgi:hypothetical protein